MLRSACFLGKRGRKTVRTVAKYYRRSGRRTIVSTEGSFGQGQLAPKVAPRGLGLLAPKLRNFWRISVQGGRFQGPLVIRTFHTTPLVFGDLTPPSYPGLRFEIDAQSMETCAIPHYARRLCMSVGQPEHTVSKTGRQWVFRQRCQVADGTPERSEPCRGLA